MTQWNRHMLLLYSCSPLGDQGPAGILLLALVKHTPRLMRMQADIMPGRSLIRSPRAAKVVRDAVQGAV